MNSKLHITFDQAAFKAVCEKYHIIKLAFYGSVMRSDFRVDSDVDIMIEFAPGMAPGFELVTMLDEFSEVFGGRKVDMMTFRQLKPGTRLAHFINQDLQVYYDEAA